MAFSTNSPTIFSYRFVNAYSFCAKVVLVLTSLTAITTLITKHLFINIVEFFRVLASFRFVDL